MKTTEKIFQYGSYLMFAFSIALVNDFFSKISHANERTPLELLGLYHLAPYDVTGHDMTLMTNYFTISCVISLLLYFVFCALSINKIALLKKIKFPSNIPYFILIVALLLGNIKYLYSGTDLEGFGGLYALIQTCIISIILYVIFCAVIARVYKAVKQEQLITK